MDPRTVAGRCAGLGHGGEVLTEFKDQGLVAEAETRFMLRPVEALTWTAID